MSSRTWRRAAVALVFSASAVALSAPALASGPSSADVRTDAAVVSGSVGLGLSVASVIYGTKVAVDLRQVVSGTRSAFDGPSLRRNAEIGTFTCGGVLLVLGGLAVGLQASVPGPCSVGSPCQIAYGFGGASLGVGVGMLVEGIVIATARPAIRVQLPWLSRFQVRPVVSPSARGAAWGIGVGGSLL